MTIKTDTIVEHTGDAGVTVEGILLKDSQVSGKLDVKQGAAAGAVPVLQVEQVDVSEEFIRFIGTSSTDASQSLVDAADMEDPGTIVGWLKIYIEDAAVSGGITNGVYFLPVYSAPTHSP